MCIHVALLYVCILLCVPEIYVFSFSPPSLQDVIIERWIPGNSRLSGNTSLNRPPPTQLEMDESYARQLQAQYDEAPTITSWSPPVLVNSVSLIELT